MGIEINDLNAVVSKDILSYIREDDKIHLTDKGIAVCAEQVVKVIKGE
jgi:sulfur transfer complex TusBCD TusB component (DsrH family)